MLLRSFVLGILVIFSSTAFPQIKPQKGEVVSIVIHPSKRFQTIDNFGASDAWAGQFVGNWPSDKRNKLADLLFSTKKSKSGQPLGIGLSLWRFNFGAGSSEQGDSSGIKDPWRRAESFLDGKVYNWSKQAGQVWLAKAAKARGVKQFLGFFNSPPVQFTKNGKSFSSDGGSNIASDQYPFFADYMVNVVKGLEKEHGIQFDFISPVNEPQWDWKDGKQEGAPFTNDEISNLISVLDSKFSTSNLRTKIVVPEAAKLNYLLTDADKPLRGSQIDAFFGIMTKSKQLNNLAPIVAGHSYFTTSPFKQSVKLREELKDKIATLPDHKFWMTEYCILGDNDGEINGSKRDTGIDPALYIAKVIHTDLVHANASAWQWWLAISPYNYKDGLIYIDKNTTDGDIYPSKMLWALGNYSRFITPGSVRVYAQANNSVDEKLLCSSYVTPDKELITVVVNSGEKPQLIDFAIKGKLIGKGRSYITSASTALHPAPWSRNGSYEVPAKAIVTFVSKLGKT